LISSIAIKLASLTAVSLMDIVPDKECNTPTLIVSELAATGSEPVAIASELVGAGSAGAACSDIGVDITAGAEVGVAGGEDPQATRARASTAPRTNAMYLGMPPRRYKVNPSMGK
jgi:hypothetical protein